MTNELLNFRAAQPSADLRRWIHSYYELVTATDAPNIYEGLVVPDGHLELGFQLSGRCSECVDCCWVDKVTSGLDGVLLKARRLRWTGPFHYVAVKFQLDVGVRPLGIEAIDIARQSVPLPELAQGQLNLLPALLAASTSWQHRVATLDQALSRFAYSAEADELVALVVARMSEQSTANRIGAIEMATGVSRRTLEKRVRSLTGFSPKQLSIAIRTRQSIRHVQRSPDATLCSIAQEMGYFDQAHFTHSFRKVIGTSPSDFFESSHFVSDMI